MKTIALQQGSLEWLAHRRTTRNASDAPAMMGASPYVSRAQLVRQVATGLEREIDDATQRIFDRGHDVEPLLRAIAEGLVGEDFYPVTGVSDDGYLGASFDGVTLGEDAILEAKQSNAAKQALMDQGKIPPQDYWQIVQQFAVCELAERCYYLVGDGTEAGTNWMLIARKEVEADIPKLRAGWAQFDADVAAYKPEAEAAPAPTGRAPDALPALSIQVTGMVTASNLAEFKANALAVLGGINRELQTDEDFANAEQTVKWCKGVEERLEATKQQVLGQTADIDAVFRTMDEVGAETRRIRLELDKLVAKEKENRRLEIVTTGRDAYAAHVQALKAETKDVWLPLPAPDFAGAIKGKRTLTSMKDAVDTTLAQAKIAASESAAHIRAALACLSEEMGEHRHLFADWQSLVAKPVEDIRALVRGRIAEHQQRETDRIEREREKIRAEEAAKLEAEQRARDQEAAKVSEEKPAQPAAAPIEAAPSPAGIGRTAPAGVAERAAPGARMKLGEINARLEPLSITADGLATLGFQPVGKEGAAKLYAAEDFDRMCRVLGRWVADAATRSIGKAA